MTFYDAINEPPIPLPGTITPSDWVCGPHVGISSKCIWSVMNGVKKLEWSNQLTPSDPDDFSRCWRLLQIFPEWKARLPEVSALYPKWKPFVDNWDEMERLWYTEWKSRSAPKLYRFMKTLEAK